MSQKGFSLLCLRFICYAVPIIQKLRQHRPFLVVDVSSQVWSRCHTNSLQARSGALEVMIKLGARWNSWWICFAWCLLTCLSLCCFFDLPFVFYILVPFDLPLCCFSCGLTHPSSSSLMVSVNVSSAILLGHNVSQIFHCRALFSPFAKVSCAIVHCSP